MKHSLTPDAIVILAAGIKQNTIGRWASTDLTEADNKLGAPGGILRVRAAAVLSNRYPSAAVIASGGKGFDVPKDAPDHRPLLCEILRDELLDAGVPPGRIVLEKQSNTTYQQLSALAALVGEHGWTYVAVVTNCWHLQRVYAIIRSKLHGLADSVEVVSAEEVLIAHNKEEWESSIAQAYASGWLARRIESEDNGVRQIKEGTYEFK